MIDAVPGATGSASAPTAGLAAPRFHGLDWLRAIAALAVVALHAGIAYTIQPFPGLAWPVHDSQPSPLVDAATWWIDSWIMPSFFMMGGLLAAQLFQRLGPIEFLRHRTRRLLVPLAFACVVILPLDLYVWLLGWVVEERIPLKKLRSLKLGETGRDLWGVAHLWFLQYLFVFCVAAWAVHQMFAWITRVSAQRDVGRFIALRFPLSALRFRLFIGLLAAVSALALWWDPQIVIGFRHAWHPLPANLLYYAPCFAAGWWMMHHRSGDRRAARTAMMGLLASPVLFAAALPLIHAHAASPLVGTQRVLLVGLFTACGWMTALAALRLSLNPCGSPPRVVVQLSQASFWLYLFHHPMVGLAQVALHGSPLSAGAKFTLAWISATALSLLTYEVGVRRTWIGRLLSGRRASASPASNESAAVTAPSERSLRSAA